MDVQLIDRNQFFCYLPNLPLSSVCFGIDDCVALLVAIYVPLTDKRSHR